MVKKILILAILFLNCALAQNKTTFYVGSWNVENLFDTLDNPTKDDNEFLPESEKKWNADKYNSKLKNLAQVINEMNNKQGPDMLGLIEVENIYVVNDLLKSIKSFNLKEYKIAHVESLDPRGIDNALLYNSLMFELLETTPIRIQLETENAETRYILKLEFVIKNLKKKNKLIIYVNHWPSRRGGEDTSEKNRIAAAQTLISDIDRLDKKNANIIIFGDFNDEPSNKSLYEVLNAKKLDKIKNEEVKLFNLAIEKKELGEGTYYYRGTWNMLDQMIISKNLLSEKKVGYIPNSFEIIRPEFMITKEGNFKGSSIPTYGGKKYLGGYSDHFPIGAKFYINTK